MDLYTAFLNKSMVNKKMKNISYKTNLLLAMLIFVSNLFGATPLDTLSIQGVDSWENLYFDSANTAYQDESLNYPVLPSEILLNGGRISLPNLYQISYDHFEYRRPILYMQDKTSFKKYALPYKYTIFKDGHLFMSLENDGYSIIIDGNSKNYSPSYITSAKPVPGTDIVYDFKIGKLSFYDEHGLLWEKQPSYGNVSRIWGDLAYCDGEIRNIRTGELYKQQSWGISDGDVCCVDIFERDVKGASQFKHTLVFRCQDGSTIGLIPYHIDKIKSDCLEAYEDDTKTIHKRTSVARFSKKDCSFIEKLEVSEEQADSGWILLDSHRNMGLLKSGSNWSIINLVTGKECLDFKGDQPPEWVYFGNDGLTVCVFKFGVQLYDLNTIESTGKPKIIQTDGKRNNKIYWSESCDFKFSKGNLLYLKTIEDGSQVVPRDPDILQVKASNGMKLPGVFINTTASSLISRINYDNNKYTKIYEDKGMVSIDLWSVGKSEPLVHLSSDLNGLKHIGPVTWKDGKFFITFLSEKDEYETFSILQIDPRNGQITKKYKINDRAFKSYDCDNERLLAVDEKHIVVFNSHNVWYINLQTEEIKKIGVPDLLENSTPILVGNYVLIDNATGIVRVVNLATGEVWKNHYLIGIQNGCAYLLPDKSNVPRKIKVIDSKNNTVTDIAAPQILQNEQYMAISTCKNAFLMNGAILSNKFDLVQKIPEHSKSESIFKIFGGSAYINKDGSLFKLSPCPSFSVERTGKGGGDGKDGAGEVSFEFRNTREDGRDLVLKGEVYLVSWGDDGKAPVFAKLNEPRHKLGPLLPGMSQEISFKVPEPPLLENNQKGEGKYFALVVESNGLMDREKSVLSEYDKDPRPLFDGTPVALDQQKAIVVTVWGR